MNMYNVYRKKPYSFSHGQEILILLVWWMKACRCL